MTTSGDYLKARRSQLVPERYGVGIVGTGAAARHHSEAIADMEELDLRAVAEPTDKPAGEWGAPVVSVQELFDDPRVDIVALCVPPGARNDLLHRALVERKATVIEKPAAMSVLQYKEVRDLRESAKVPLAVMFQHRFALPGGAYDGDWNGAVATVHVVRHRPASHYQVGWRAETGLSAGGFLAHVAIHYVDLVCQLLGAPTAVRHILRHDYDVAGIDTRGALAVSFDAGGLLSASFSALPQSSWDEVAIIAANSRLRIANGQGTLVSGTIDEAWTVPQRSHLQSRVYGEVVHALRSRDWQLERSDFARSESITRLLDALH